MPRCDPIILLRVRNADVAPAHLEANLAHVEAEVLLMWKTLLMASLMIVPALLVTLPTASAAPVCDASLGKWGVGVVCQGGSGAIGVCALTLYDTQNVRWAIAGGYACV